jgi:ligand-binding sensor domain-containing protein
MNSILISLIWLVLADTPPAPAKLQPVQEGVIRLWPGPETWLKSQNPGPEELQISSAIHNILEDKSGNIWIATGKDGVCYFNGKDYFYFTTADGLSGNSVRTILQDANGDIWLATNGGVTRRNATGFTAYTIANGLPDNEVLTLHLDKKGRIWAGTRKGLARFEKEAFETIPMYREPRPENPLPVQTPVHTIYEDGSGQLWFGTDGFGLFRYDGKTLLNIIKPGC